MNLNQSDQVESDEVVDPTTMGRTEELVWRLQQEKSTQQESDQSYPKLRKVGLGLGQQRQRRRQSFP